MIRVQYIFQYKTLVLLTGMLIAIAIVSGPVLKEYIDSHVVKSEQTEQQEDKKSQSQVSALEAVAPVLQFNFNVEEILLEVLTIEHSTEQKGAFNYVSEAPQKFLKVLFRWIIAPNAP